MNAKHRKSVRCAIYARVSTDQGLEQDFNSLDAQYDASQAYIRSQVHAGWALVRTKYEDGGFSGGNTDRPALQRLLVDVPGNSLFGDSNADNKSANWPHSWSLSGNLCKRRTAWWAREDSNLQPDRYERSALTS